MRTGRPVFHVKARWVTIARPDGTHFFRLDDKGKLELHKGLIQPHHVVAWDTSAVNDTVVEPEPKVEEVEVQDPEPTFDLDVIDFNNIPFDQVEELEPFDLMFDL